MLTSLTTWVILSGTLLLFFCTVLIPIKFKVSALWNAPDDNFISSRQTQSWWSIGFSLYAGAVGTWVLTAPPEIAVTAGGWGVIFYAIGCGCPWLMYMWTGPIIRDMMGSRGFTSLEFVLERYGRGLHVIVTSVSILYLTLMLIAELTAIGSCLVSLSPSFPAIGATLSISLVTNIYSAMGGFPASMLTDKLQGILTLLLVILCYGAVFGDVKQHINLDVWYQAMYWPSNGVSTGFTLAFSCLVVEQLNQATWQRVFAARTHQDIYKGFTLGSFLMFPSMVIFGLGGIFARAANIVGYINIPDNAAYQSMFLLLSKLSNVWLGFVVFLSVGLVTSTADTIQTGLAATIAGELTDKKLSLNWARVFSLVLNIPAVILAAFHPPSIITVMMIGNIVTLAVVPAVFAGFSRHVTSLGALIAILSSLSSIFLIGFSVSLDVKYAILWITFPHGYDWLCFATMLLVSSISLVGTFLFSFIDVKVNPHKRQLQIDVLNAIRKRNEETVLLHLQTDACKILSFNKSTSMKSDIPS